EPHTGEQFVYQVPNFDVLVDSPVEMGTQAIYEFAVRGKAHQLAVWGEGMATGAKSNRFFEGV
ncbi:MAG: hypothetical protein ACK5CA_03570, partial [Cyanobacteriota bacterium]